MRYSYKYKWINSQPNEKGEYYIYRFEKDKKNKENLIINVYKMRNKKIRYIGTTKIKNTDYYGFKKFQEQIENKKGETNDKHK